MKLFKNNRKFLVSKKITLTDRGRISLLNNEQFSIVIGNKKNDITKKKWGFYLTNSCNSSLKNKGLKTAIIKGKMNKRIFVCLVDKRKIKIFKDYLKHEQLVLKKWLDSY